jgi:hypothetical protein
MTSFTNDQAKIAEILRQVEQASLQLATVCNVAVQALSQMSQEQTFNNAQQNLMASLYNKKSFAATNGHMQQPSGYAFGSHPPVHPTNFVPMRVLFGQQPAQYQQQFAQEQAPVQSSSSGAATQHVANSEPAPKAKKSRAQTEITVDDVVEYIKSGRKQTGELVAHFNLPVYVVRGLAKLSNHLSFDADGFWNYSEKPVEKVARRTAADVLSALQKKNGETVKTSILAKQLNLHPKMLNKLANEAGCITTDEGFSWKAPAASEAGSD